EHRPRPGHRALVRSAAGDSGENGDDVVGTDRRVELVEVPHVVVVAVHVDELVDGAVIVEQLTLEQGELPEEVLEDRTHRLAVGLHRGLPARVLAEDGRKAYFDFDGHAWMLPTLEFDRLL